MADEPVTAWREPWVRGARRWMRRHRTAVTSAAAAAIVALSALSVLAAVQTRNNRQLRLSRDQSDRRAEHLLGELRAVQRDQNAYRSFVPGRCLPVRRNHQKWDGHGFDHLVRDTPVQPAVDGRLAPDRKSVV